MTNFIRKNRIILIAAAVIICLTAALMAYRTSRMDMLDTAEYTALYRDIRDAADEGRFSSQQDLTDYITAWGDSSGLEYKIDKKGNIVFITGAVERKKNLSPTVVCVSYNYQTARDNARLLASAAMIARTELNSGKKTVIFVSDEQNSGDGYRYLSSRFFKNKAKVIYLDYGGSDYMSTASFAKKYQTITVKGSHYDPVCDTAVRIHISGINTAVIGTGIGSHPDPVGALSTLLTRLKSKSSICQLADLEVGSNGSMYPSSIDAVILLNSYAVPSFTKYIDKRIKAWEKAYAGDHPELSYTYEVIDDPEQIPETAYSRKATERLTNVLYTIQTGLYKYENSDTIPEGLSAGDIYGINAIINVRTNDDSICIDLMTQARDEESMQRIFDDNTAAAELFDCNIKDTYDIPAFSNDRDSLSRTFRSTYFKINGVFNATDVISEESDNYFTPCSYLADKNKNADIIHVRLDSDRAARLTNTILCYISYKGNILM